MTYAELSKLAKKAGKACKGKDWDSYNKQCEKISEVLDHANVDPLIHNTIMDIFEKYAN